MSRVTKKILYYVDVICFSPIAVSGGSEGYTDSDVLRDYDGTPFVSGSSLAGAFRNYLGSLKEEDCLFGFSSATGTDGKMSSLFISDMNFCEEKVTTAVRNGVELGENKTALTGKKYDFEVVDTGTTGRFIMELVVREEDCTKEEENKEQIHQVLKALEEHEIRIGAKKTRGFGELEIQSIRVKEYTQDNILDYANAYMEKEFLELPDQREEILSGELDRKYVTIRVPLRLEGGISIRQYSAKKNMPDFVHQTVQDKTKDTYGIPVIPGTSFGGVIRHRVSEIMQELQVSDAEKIMKAAFGFVDGKKAHISNVVFGESQIEGSQPLPMVRNAVSRFESAAREGSLYKELSYFKGTTELVIKVRKGIFMEQKNKQGMDITNSVIGFLIIAIKDMQNGYLPVGGQTAIGRGLLLEDGEIILEGTTIKPEEYMKNCLDPERSCENHEE